MKEENMDDTLTEEDYSYEDSVQFYIDDIKTWAAPVLDGFEWGGEVDFVKINDNKEVV
jgi:hypothetical protein